jgi:hypothetical protein
MGGDGGSEEDGLSSRFVARIAAYYPCLSLASVGVWSSVVGWLVNIL